MSMILGHYRGVQIESYYTTGGWQQVADHLERSIASFARTGRGVDGIYIGIASGRDQLSGLKSRVDARKVDLGIERMVCVYESTSRYFVERVESRLVQNLGIRDERTLNAAPGGGGRKPDNPPWNFVYFALRYGIYRFL